MAKTVNSPVLVDVRLRVNGTAHAVAIDTRTSLLDLLREHLDLTGAENGCSHGQCGACTVSSWPRTSCCSTWTTPAPDASGVASRRR